MDGSFAPSRSRSLALVLALVLSLSLSLPAAFVREVSGIAALRKPLKAKLSSHANL